MSSDGDLWLVDVVDADELCRRLLEAPGWGRSSTEHAEAVELLARVRGTSKLGAGLVALLLCTCPRWRRVTGRLIAAIEARGLLADAELDELSDALLADEVTIIYPLAWVSPQWLDVDVEDPASSVSCRIDESTQARASRRIAPPLRRWAARRVLTACPARLDELLATADALAPDGRAAVVLGLVDAAGAIAPAQRRRLASIGLATGMARVRLAAIALACELDGPDAALRRARSDPDARVRAWRPRPDLSGTAASAASAESNATLSLL